VNQKFVKPKPGGVAEIQIDRLSVKGHGIGNYGDYQVLIRGAIPGDLLHARFRKVRHRRRECEAAIVERIESSVDREEAECEHFGLCGGCLWQNIPYDEQLHMKQKLVINAVKPAGDVEIAEPMRAPRPLRYRNKMEFSFGAGDEGQVEIGLHPAGQFGRIFDLDRCELMPARTSDIVSVVRKAAADLNLAAYDLRQHTGLLRFLTVREGSSSGQAMVIVTTSAESFPEADEVATRIVDEIPGVESVIHTINTEKAQVAFGQESRVLAGKGSIQDQLGPFTFDISPSSFFQPNAEQAALMFEEVVRLCDLEGGERVLDAYCGTGGISLFLSLLADSVVGVEASEEAIRDASRNSAQNSIYNCEFISGPAEDLLGHLRDQGDRFDVAVTDPPRAGMHHKATRALVDLGPKRIVYVSCNPAALAQDILILEAHGYVLKRLQLVDMLPQTPHCEVLARLDKE
jgi:23S rRNA (uracil1939-C5)-methyltransferase